MICFEFLPELFQAITLEERQFFDVDESYKDSVKDIVKELGY